MNKKFEEAKIIKDKLTYLNHLQVCMLRTDVKFGVYDTYDTRTAEEWGRNYIVPIRNPFINALIRMKARDVCNDLAITGRKMLEDL